MGRWRTEVGKQGGGGEYERGGGRTHMQGAGANNGRTCHVCGTHDRLRGGGRATDMELHLERVPKVRTERGQREIGQRKCKD
eukprot:1219008-Pleurochrysis_carterae.AAC.1